jgi:phosphatidate cytidylyltransferase
MTLGGLFTFDPPTEKIATIVLGLLIFFTILFYVWKMIKPIPLLQEMITRTHSWWMIFILYLVFFCIHPRFGQVGLALLGFGALKEFFDKFPEEQLPRRVRLLASIFAFVQFGIASQGHVLPTAILLPVFFFILVTVWTLLFEAQKVVMTAPMIALWGLLLTVSGLSHLALLLSVSTIAGWAGTMSGIFLYFVFLTQFNDVLQFIWGSLFGRHLIAPELSPKKTWEGFLGGVMTTTVLAFVLRDITPFSALQSLLVGAGLGITGYLGDLNISAIKRNLNLKDMGTLIPGHGGLLDRIDSLTLSSLIYFYLIEYWYGPLGT